MWNIANLNNLILYAICCVHHIKNNFPWNKSVFYYSKKKKMYSFIWVFAWSYLDGKLLHGDNSANLVKRAWILCRKNSLLWRFVTPTFCLFDLTKNDERCFFCCLACIGCGGMAWVSSVHSLQSICRPKIEDWRALNPKKIAKSKKCLVNLWRVLFWWFYSTKWDEKTINLQYMFVFYFCLFVSLQFYQMNWFP